MQLVLVRKQRPQAACKQVGRRFLTSSEQEKNHRYQFVLGKRLPVNSNIAQSRNKAVRLRAAVRSPRTAKVMHDAENARNSPYDCRDVRGVRETPEPALEPVVVLFWKAEHG